VASKIRSGSYSEQNQVGLVLGGQSQQLVTVGQENAIVTILLELPAQAGAPQVVGLDY
jgi:hypothetical protein